MLAAAVVVELVHIQFKLALEGLVVVGLEDIQMVQAELLGQLIQAVVAVERQVVHIRLLVMVVLV
jgi:hypothetical protein